MNIFIPNFESDQYIVAKYYLESLTNLRDAAWELAIGQSVGNPSIRSKWETEELFKNHSCIILEYESELAKHKSGYVNIAFPISNIDLATDGISQLLCHLMGGQLDIDNIKACHLLEIKFPDRYNHYFYGPKFGISGIRKFTNVYDKPLLGGIVKPKIVTSPEMLLDMVTEMVDGGINFIKEDELMSDPWCCPLNSRLKIISPYLQGKNVIYSYCINSDSPYLLERVRKVHEMGGNSVHVNFWSGMGSYRAIRELDLPLFIHFQKSGDKILTNKTHAYHIEWDVICDLAGRMGVDFIHAGMWGGYMSDSAVGLVQTLNVLRNRNVMPALSCGMHPGLVNAITTQFGTDYMANVGGALHGHPNGTLAGTKAMRQAIDGNYGEEYELAIKKWGLVI